jgi:hypothetical protein
MSYCCVATILWELDSGFLVIKHLSTRLYSFSKKYELPVAAMFVNGSGRN